MASLGTIAIGSFVSFSTSAPATFDQAGFAALVDWVDYDEATTIGQIGTSAAVLEYTPVRSGFVEKRIGSKNAGTQTIEGPYVSADPAQSLLKTAYDSRNEISVRETLNEGTIIYYRAYVSDFNVSDAEAGSIQMMNGAIAITGEPIFV